MYALQDDSGLKEYSHVGLDSVNGFIENKGQLTNFSSSPVPFVYFKKEIPGCDVYITEKGLTFVFYKATEIKENEEDEPGESDERIEYQWERVDLILENASIKKENVQKLFEVEQGVNNYFYAHCPQGVTNVKEYSKILIKDIYPNIDWVIMATGDNRCKHEFVLNPGADPDDIQLRFRSGQSNILNESGAVFIRTKVGSYHEAAPTSFFNDEFIESNFEVQRVDSVASDCFDVLVGFKIPNEYSRRIKTEENNRLIIDPELVWLTLFGGTGFDAMYYLETDSEGNMVSAGYTTSIVFPTYDAGTFYQEWISGGIVDPEMDMIIAKFDENHTQFWATYYGGSTGDRGQTLAIDGEDNIFVTCQTYSDDFPLMDYGSYFDPTANGEVDIGIVKFDKWGNRLWSTYYGGADADVFHSSAIDKDGNLILSGATKSHDIPTQDFGGYFDPVIGGPDEYDAFFMKFDNVGNLLWATYFGGNNIDFPIAGKAGPDNNLVFVGYTESEEFPVLDYGGFFMADIAAVDNNDGFIVEFDEATNLIWSSYYGGENRDRCTSLEIDENNTLWVAGLSSSNDLPLVDNGHFFQSERNGMDDIFLLQFNTERNMNWGSYFGGSGSDQMSSYDNLALDRCNNIYLSFNIKSEDIITQEFCDLGYYQEEIRGNQDQFLAQFSLEGNLLGATYFGTPSDEDFRAPLAYDLNDNLWFSGEWNDYNIWDTLMIDDPGDGSYYDGDKNGGHDLFFAKFERNHISPEIIIDSSDDECGLCVGTVTAIVLNSNSCSGLNFIWSNGVEVLNSTDTVSTIEDLCGGTYSLIIYDNCDTIYHDSLTIESGEAIPFDLVFNNPSCYGFTDGSVVIVTDGELEDPVFVIEDSTGVILNIDNSNTANNLGEGWYYILVEDGSGCYREDSIFLDDPDPLLADLEIGHPLCFGDSSGWALIDSVYNFAGVYDSLTYIWNPNPLDNNGINADSIYTLLAGNYNVIINDQNGCSVQLDFEIIQPDELSFVEFGMYPAFCRTSEIQSGNGVVFGAANGGTPDYTYLWTHLETGITETNSTWGGLNPGNYNLEVLDANGCILSETIQLDSLNPIADFIVVSDQLDESLEGTELVIVQFINKSLNFSNPYDEGADTTFFWSLDQFNDSWYVSHDYFEPIDTLYTGEEIYEVCLVAINKNGCTDTLCKELIVHVQPEFTAPNVFTPGNGVNDIFTFEYRSVGIQDFNCTIVNRWGVKVAELNEVTDGWDGTAFNGLDCPNGVYFYTYNAISTNGTVFKGQGNVQLIRN